MSTLSQRIEALEKIIFDRKPIEPVKVIFLNVQRDDPEDHERKKQEIAAINAAGKRIIVFEVIDASVKNGEA